MEYQPEGKLLKPEEDSHRTGAHDTQLIDLATEESAALEELDSSIPTGKICPSHTMHTGVSKADRHLTGSVDNQASDDGKEIPLWACTTRAGEDRYSAPQWQPDQRAGTEETDVSDIPEWILEENLHLNRSITPPAGQLIRDQGERNDGTVDRRRSLVPCSTWVVELIAGLARH
jgi:hypothetical protein